MRFGILVFPGSNCDFDCYYVIKNLLGQSAEFIWHKETDLPSVDALIIPGGFSYGDYLRTGAIAHYSPIMANLRKFTDSGRLVLGICNGFQILMEAGLLPGAMLRNQTVKFICRDIHIRVDSSRSPCTAAFPKGRVLKMPVAHADGNYYADSETLRSLEKNQQILFRYCSEDGQITVGDNPNGSLNAIAGICNPDGNIVGMMPHPERCSEGFDGNSDGLLLFQSILEQYAIPAG